MTIIQSENFVQSPLVSVVIPSYNRANTISQTIDSIVGQQCAFDFEIVIGDDCSTDNAREVLSAYQAAYPEKIKLLFHEENIGLGANWAICIKHCRGKYIANCDNDDYWHNPQKMHLQVDFMEQNLQYGLCHTDYRKHNRTTGKIEEIKCKNKLNETENQQDAVMWGHFVCCNASVMYRKSVLLQYVNLDDYIKRHFTLQDWNTWMLLAPFTEFGCLHISTATFGVETVSITRPDTVEALARRYEKERECYKYVCDKFPEKNPYTDEGWYTYTYERILRLAYRSGDYKSAKNYASKLKTYGHKSLRIKCTANIIGFYCFRILTLLKKKL